MTGAWDWLLSVGCSWCVAVACLAAALPATESLAASKGDCQYESSCMYQCCTWYSYGGRFDCYCDYCCIA